MKIAKELIKPQGVRCGFCSTGNHDRCPGATANDARPVRKVWPCTCREPGCGGGSTRFRCLDCKQDSDTANVDPDIWQCVDRDACLSRTERRLAANPDVQRIRNHMERGNEMARTAKKAAAPISTKPTPEPKDCTCQCGGTTKGGMFLPGHDARYVGEMVREVVEAGTKKAEDTARRQLRNDEVSDALVGKFEKSLNIARAVAAKKGAEKAAAPVAAKKAAPAKRAAKTAPARKSATAKKAALTVVEDDETFDGDDGF